MAQALSAHVYNMIMSACFYFRHFCIGCIGVGRALACAQDFAHVPCPVHDKLAAETSDLIWKKYRPLDAKIPLGAPSTAPEIALPNIIYSGLIFSVRLIFRHQLQKKRAMARRCTYDGRPPPRNNRMVVCDEYYQWGGATTNRRELAELSALSHIATNARK